MAITYNVYNEANHSIWVNLGGLIHTHVGLIVTLAYLDEDTPGALWQDGGSNEIPRYPECDLEYRVSLNYGHSYLVDVIVTGEQHAYITRISIPQQPTKMHWHTPKVQGGTFNLTAAEWNGELLRSLREVKSYLGSSVIIPNNVSKGAKVTAQIFCDVIDAIQGLFFQTSLEKPYPGDEITAKLLNDMRDEINDYIERLVG